jgi:UDP-N-acetylmuramate dehydrogenase
MRTQPVEASLPFAQPHPEGDALRLEPEAPIKTWFGVGGKARQFAYVRSLSQLRHALRMEPSLRVLGDGANLLVDDAGVQGLVVKLADALSSCTISDEQLPDGKRPVYVGAGAHLFKVMNQTVAAGLGGLEVLAGIPACMGGAIVMNAGGAFGQIADVVRTVYALKRDEPQTLLALPREHIAFGYRTSGLTHLVIVGAELALTPGDATTLEARKREINDYKRRTQPMSASSAGCCFKNPTLDKAIEGMGLAGERVSAGKLIDLAGLKGTTLGTAIVSPLHGNFLISADPDTGNAADVIALIEHVRARVRERFGVSLETEVVVWRNERVAHQTQGESVSQGS